MLIIYDEFDRVRAMSVEAVKIDMYAWDFCFWCHPKDKTSGHPNNSFHQQWEKTEMTQICIQCGHEEVLPHILAQYEKERADS